MNQITIGKHTVGLNSPVYFVADIGANHDGCIERAKHLIRLAGEAGADAAKFQNFQAAKIVSSHGFAKLGKQLSHQRQWEKPVFDVYLEASLPWSWTEALKAECARANIDYFSTPYDFGAVDMLNSHVPAYKIGSGDITWDEMLEKISSQGKPVILSTGASEIGEVQHAVRTIRRHNKQLIVMQCNTNYTGSTDNFSHVNLNVLITYRTMFPGVVLGLSDHTPGHAVVLGAVSLGARVIEKHFTDDNSRKGPDHSFAMNPRSWKEMVSRTRELERALGSSEKCIAPNEQDTVVLQRRCLRAARDLKAGEVLDRTMIEVLRPAPKGALSPNDLKNVLGWRVHIAVLAGEALSWNMLSKP
jgi:sialic acid synthase SpsE